MTSNKRKGTYPIIFYSQRDRFSDKYTADEKIISENKL